MVLVKESLINIKEIIKQGLIRELPSDLRTVEEADIDAAISLFENYGAFPTVEKDIKPFYRHIIKFLRDFRRAETKEISIKATRTQRIKTKTLAKILEPEIQAIRKTVFKTGKPLNSSQEAAKWLFKNHPLLYDYELAAKIEIHPLVAKMELSEKRNIEKAIMESLSVQYGKLEKLKPLAQEAIRLFNSKKAIVNKKTNAVSFIEPSLDFKELYDGIQGISKSVGWEYWQVLIYILMGEMPEIEPLKLTIHYGIIIPSNNKQKIDKKTGLKLIPKPNRYKWITVKIRDKEVTFDTLRQLYKQARDELDLAKKWPLEGKNLDVYQFVEARKANFKKLSKSAWLALQKEWNEKYKNKPKWSYRKSKDGFTSLKKAYERTKIKLEQL